MASLYWLEEALPGMLPTLWTVLGVGLPWAFAALPPRQWRSRPLVMALALALGPAWVTAWMLVLGVVGAQYGWRLYTPAWILPGTVVIAGAGLAIAWRKRRRGIPACRQPPPLELDEKLIIALIAVALIVRWIHSAFWPFTAYDALWVYGYQGRLYFHEGNIPQAVGYYPQFLPLQFTYVQVLIGAINDHAARMALPWLNIGSILAAYLLGERLVNRRVGLFAAALWSLHPFVGQWAYVGDLEIPLTFSFTLAAVFFLRAWLEQADAAARRANGILAGVLLGIALFTKPTAGAFIWGVVLLLAFDLARVKLDLNRWLPRFSVAIWTGLACLPLGGAWYLRNLLLNQEVIILPKAVWLTRALRSGDFLAPLALAVLLAALVLALRQGLTRRDLATALAGALLFAGGILASNAQLFPQRGDPPASYIRLEEVIAIGTGLALIVFSLRSPRKGKLDAPLRRQLRVAAWAILLALPYFVTFFFSYSYHYRLGFAALPLLCLPPAIALSLLFDPARMRRWRARSRRLYWTALILLGIPGILAAAFDVNWSRIWLFQEDLDSDFKKYQVFNPSLMEVVTGLEDYQNFADRPALVLAPGEERLPFFFPQMKILDRPITDLAAYEALGATHFIYGAKAREAYLDVGIDPLATQLVSALGRQKLFEKTKAHYDGTFSYELYRTADLDNRRTVPQRLKTREQFELAIVFGQRLQLHAGGAYPLQIHRTTPITLEPTWIALRALDRDYEFVLQLRKHPSGAVAQEWTLRPGAHRHGYYATSLWDVGEVVNDRQVLYLAEDTKRARDTTYVFALAVWDPQEQLYLPLTIDGEPAGEFYQLSGAYRLRQ